MANSYKEYTGDASTTRFVAPEYDSDISSLLVFLAGVSQGSGWSYDSGTGEVVFNTAPGSSVAVKIQRVTSIASLLSTFNSGQIRSADLNNNFKQIFYALQEFDEIFGGVINIDTTDISTLTGTLGIANGGTGASSAAAARTALGVQALAAILTSLSSLSVVAGDIVYGSGADALSRLPKGSDGQILKLASGLPSWANEASVNAENPRDNDFRLTLSSGNPVQTTSTANATTIYLTPYKGNRIALYDGASAWAYLASAEVSISTSGFTASKPHDIFAYDNSGTLTLEAVAWTDDTNRATAITLQDGVYVKSGTTTKRYVGTVYVDGSKQCHDTVTLRYVWNMDNRVPRRMYVSSATSWTYATQTWRQANGSSTYQVDFVCGLSKVEDVAMFLHASAHNSTPAIGIGYDSTTNPDGVISVSEGDGGGDEVIPMVASIVRQPGLGKHYFAWLETVAELATTTFMPDDSGLSETSGRLWGTFYA